MEAGYSKSPLARKLGIKPGSRLLFRNLPAHYFDLFDSLPADLKVMEGIRKDAADFIHLFYTDADEFEKTIGEYIPALVKDGSLWISWPKGTSSISHTMGRDYIRRKLLALGLVDVKVAAIDDDWSGLKFMYRVKDR